jgi:hypothetical protein
MSHRLHLVTTQPITRDDACARLVAHGTKPLSATRLALEWGWSRSKVRRLIARCQAEGLIPAKADSPPHRKPEPMPVAPAAPTQAAAARLRDNDNEERLQGSNPLAPPRHASIGNKLLALVLGTTALMLGGVGLILNVTFAQSFGRSALAAELLAVLGGVIDVMTIILPTVAESLWRQRQIPAALVAWVIWCGVLTMTLIAASGFAATNIGDTVQSRSNVASERDSLTEKLGHLRQDRNAIAEARAPSAIEALIRGKSRPVVRAAGRGARDSMWKDRGSPTKKRAQAGRPRRQFVSGGS